MSMPKFGFAYGVNPCCEHSESLGKVLKVIEEEWIKNGFKISDEKIKELIIL